MIPPGVIPNLVKPSWNTDWLPRPLPGFPDLTSYFSWLIFIFLYTILFTRRRCLLYMYFLNISREEKLSEV